MTRLGRADGASATTALASEPLVASGRFRLARAGGDYGADGLSVMAFQIT